MLRQRLLVDGVIPHRQDAAVDIGVQRLHPAVHDLGKAGDIADVNDGDPGLFDGPHRAAGGDDLHPRR